MKQPLLILLFFVSACTKAQTGILGVVVSPAAPTGTTFYTSDYMVSDADLSMHSTTYGTDNTAAMQALLDLGGNAAAPITIYVDGQYSATQLKVKSYTTIICTDNTKGFIQRPSVNLPFVTNYNRTGQGQTAQNQSITIQGGIWNGSGHQVSGAANRAYYGAEGWNQVFQFHGVNDLTLTNCALRNGRTFLCYITNSDGVNISGCSFNQSPSLPDVARGNEFIYIHDGLKFGGNTHNINVTNVSGYTVDDFMSLCPNDGFVPTPGAVSLGWLQVYSPWAIYGNITNVVVDGVTFQSGYHGFRLLTVSHQLQNITIRNVTGTVNQFALVCDNYVPSETYYSGGTSGYCSSLTLENWNITVVPNTTSYPSSSYFNGGFSFNTVIPSLSMEGITYAGYQSGYPAVKTGANPALGSANVCNITTFYANNFSVSGVSDPLTAMDVSSGTITNQTGNVW
jgi:hypothetical protein